MSHVSQMVLLDVCLELKKCFMHRLKEQQQQKLLIKAFVSLSFAFPKGISFSTSLPFCVDSYTCIS